MEFGAALKKNVRGIGTESVDFRKKQQELHGLKKWRARLCWPRRRLPERPETAFVRGELQPYCSSRDGLVF